MDSVNEKERNMSYPAEMQASLAAVQMASTTGAQASCARTKTAPSNKTALTIKVINSR